MRKNEDEIASIRAGETRRQTTHPHHSSTAANAATEEANAAAIATLNAEVKRLKGEVKSLQEKANKPVSKDVESAALKKYEIKMAERIASEASNKAHNAPAFHPSMQRRRL